MPIDPGRRKISRGKAKRSRPRPRFREEPAVTRARLAAAEGALKILSGAPTAFDVVELARGIEDLADRSIDRVHAACGDARRVACRAGCAYCCTLPVAASAPEVLAIAAFVRDRFDDDRRAALDARVEASIAATRGMDMDRRSLVRLDCPFLEAGECSAYEVRPVACRGVSSYSVDDCRADHEDPGAGVEIPANTLRERVFGAIREGLAVACRSASAEHRLLELARAYRIAAEDPTLLDTWRARPEAFAAAVGASVFPGPWSDEVDREFDEVYREIIDDLDAGK